ncbi:MAG: hypothetical protein GC162_10050 [Planctomycetes bacterium]|nr:hypothetical protein [Planctomycetota bacterium]
MINNRAAILLHLPLMTVVLAGCGNDFARSDLGPDSPRGREVTAIIEQLRSADAAHFDQFTADALTPAQNKAVQLMLNTLARSPDARLTSFERFGDNVYRAGFDVNQRTLYALLIDKNNHLLFAGPN